MIRSSVVLPAPDGPTSAMNSPLATVRSMSRTAGVRPNTQLTPCSDTPAAAAASLASGTVPSPGWS